MRELFKQRDYFGLAIFLIATGLLLFFFIVKILHFCKLDYQSDLFSHIQTSRSWLQGRPIMFENNYGDHAIYHNYFFNLLMGPFALWWGAYGIFISQFALYLWAIWISFPIIYSPTATTAKNLIYFTFYIGIFFGPYAFWLYDDPWFGFHTEMLYIPLSIIFISSLLKKHTFFSILSALFILLVKEDGAVLLACLHLLFFTYKWQTGSIIRAEWLKNSILWGVVWVAVFITGVFYLKYKNHFEATRLDKAIDRMHELGPGVYVEYFIGVLKSFALLLLPLIGFIIFIRPAKWKIALWALLLLVPIVAVNIISGLYYLPHKDFSITWVPRFSLVFGFYLGLVLLQFSSGYTPWTKQKPVAATISVIALIVIFGGQVFLLKKEKNYPFYKNAVEILSAPHPEKAKPYISELKNIAKVLPHDYPVAPPYWTFALFHKHDFLWISSAYNAWQQPRMVITDETKWPEVNPTERLQQPDSVIKETVSYYFEKQDRHYLVEAGIIDK